MTEPCKPEMLSTRRSVHLSRWKNDTNDGFTECELVYDQHGRLLGVDFKSERSEEPHCDSR